MEVGSEELGGGKELVLNHDVDVIVGETFAHVSVDRKVRSLCNWKSMRRAGHTLQKGTRAEERLKESGLNSVTCMQSHTGGRILTCFLSKLSPLSGLGSLSGARMVARI